MSEPEEVRQVIRKELQRARLARRTEEALAIEEALENYVVAALAQEKPT